jgi:hypothetical protein
LAAIFTFWAFRRNAGGSVRFAIVSSPSSCA